MPQPTFKHSVFINCPFDEDYAPLLEPILFCTINFGLTPRLASERLEAGENRLDKIVEMIRSCMYSIHDLSRCKAADTGDYFRMNMPFEFGIDVGLRRSGDAELGSKKFLVFEDTPYELKRAISDIAGQDVEAHRGDYERVIRAVRSFFRVEAGIDAAGPTLLEAQYATCQGWVIEKKMNEGHSERDALSLPTREIMDEMRAWVAADRPDRFIPDNVIPD